LTDKEKLIQLSRYRLKQAEESIGEATCLLSGKGSPRSIINRAYYARIIWRRVTLTLQKYNLWVLHKR
jgi:hypothetical protein